MPVVIFCSKLLVSAITLSTGSGNAQLFEQDEFYHLKLVLQRITDKRQ